MTAAARAVQVAVVRIEKAGWRWWSVRRRKLKSKPVSCDIPHWTTARLGKRGAWAVSLGGRLTRET